MIASNIATNLVAFVLVLGVLIYVHEAGHFVVAKLFRVRVLVFSFGFGKRLFGWRKGGTDYRVSAVPLGGYVRFSGENAEEGTGDPDEFLSRPKWQRFLILVAGPGMNLVIAVTFLTIIGMIGTETFIIKPVIGKVLHAKPAEKAGLQSGDRIVAINGDRIEDYDDLRMIISMNAETPVRVDYIRAGRQQTTTMTPERENTDYGPIGRAGIQPWIDPVVGRVRPNSPAAKAGLRPGDRIIAVSGHPVEQMTDLDPFIDQAKGAPIAIQLRRGSRLIDTTLPAVNPKSEEVYRGFIPPTEVKKLSLIPAIEDSLKQNNKMLRYAFITFGRLVSAQGSVKELSGPISIARISGEMLRRGWIEVMALMAMISLQLGIINLLPIPVLDGGHIMILLVEGAARRDLSLRVKERITQIGFAVLAALMIVVIYNDVITNVMLMRRG